MAHPVRFVRNPDVRYVPAPYIKAVAGIVNHNLGGHLVLAANPNLYRCNGLTS